MLHCNHLPMRVKPDIRGDATNTRYVKIRPFSNSASTFRMPSNQPVSRPLLRLRRAVPATSDRCGGLWDGVSDPLLRPQRGTVSVEVAQSSGQPNHEPRLSMIFDREPRAADAAASGRESRSGRSQAATLACRAFLAHPRFVVPRRSSAVPRVVPHAPVVIRFAFPAVSSRVRASCTSTAIVRAVAERSCGTRGCTGAGGASSGRREAMRERCPATRTFTPTWLGVGSGAHDRAGSPHENRKNQ